jgi:uncharacterized protein
MLGELTHAEIEALLRREVIARIGCHAGGRTYVVPITYVYDGDSIVGHSADGMKIRMMREGPSVCVEVDHMDDMANWQSVIAWGNYEELSGEAAANALERLATRLAPLVKSQTSVPSHGDAAGHGTEAARGLVVFRIRLHERTGRFERQ